MKVKLSKKQLGIVIAVVILGVILIAGGVTCIVKDESPAAVLSDIFYNNDDEIVGKWQSSDKDALFAYEFYEDGTYKNYSFIGLNFTGNYEVKGNKLILMNPKLSKQIVYKIKISGDEMVLTKNEEDGEKLDEKQVSTYARVEHINLKNLNEYLNEKRNEKVQEEQNK